ncbi:MAG: tetratricopeptide repeat protein [Planctomycetota bacterium]
MNPSLATSCLMALVAGCLGGCVADGTSSQAPAVEADVPPTASSAATDAVARPGEARPLAAAMSAADGVQQETSSIVRSDLLRWSDPAFRERFLNSYIADTDTEPKLGPTEVQAMQKAMTLVAEEKVDEAAALLDEQRGPSASAAFDFARGQIHYQKDELEAAAAAYRAAVDKHPKFKRAWANLAQVQYRRGEFELAVPALTKVVEMGGADAITLGLLGVCEAKSENYVAAESAFRTAMMMDPRAVEWKLGLAESLFRQARYADAAALLQAMIAEYPDRADLWRLQGEAFAMSDQPTRAAENFEMVARLGAATGELYENLGLIYAKQGIFDLAVDSYLAAVDKKPDGNLDPILRTARYLAGSGALVDARRLVDGIESRRGGNLLPDQRKEILRIRARLAAADGASEEEAQILTEIVELDPLDGDALILLGRYCGRKGDVEKAVFWFERAEGMEAFEAEAKLRHGELLARQGQYAQALPLLKRSHTLRPREDVLKYVEQVERSVGR